MKVDSSVLERYSGGAQEVEPALCCPVDYDRALLEILPKEIIERDYGCGDPSRYVREGDVVLDLGAGGGKICYMAAQLVGDSGHVHGVDINVDMLELSRGAQAEMTEKLGGDRVTFHKGFIQDLALDVDAMEGWLAANPVKSAEDYLALETWKANFRKTTPMIADSSIDLVVSNCVLNLVGEADREGMIQEIFRVLKPGGRVAISDIVSDQRVPQHLKDDGYLWSGCISGAYYEKDFLDAFSLVGFSAVSYDKWDATPWQIVEGIEFRSVTITATKRAEDGRHDRGHAVIYKGMFSEVRDDDGYVYPKGERMAVSERTYNFLTTGPLKGDFVGIRPAELKEPASSCCLSGTTRPASETQGGGQSSTTASQSCC
jgi:ubiquinone/menaquinone biosynthesis C-methylase UbiE